MFIKAAYGSAAMPILMKAERATSLQSALDKAAGEIKVELNLHGAVLLRGLTEMGETALSCLFSALGLQSLPYVYRSTPRSDLGSGIFTATEYPAGLRIPMHNEMAYQRDWPMVLAFHCLQPSSRGGQTPLCDMSRVTANIDKAILAEFRERSVCYVRNYSRFIDLPWQTVFQTSDRSAVEEFCRIHSIESTWTSAGLRTKQVCQGTAIHPVTNEELWFNQLQLFHVSNLGKEVAMQMVDVLGEEGLPRHAFYGDGGSIPNEVVAHVTAAFEKEKSFFDWEKDDLLLVDNMAVAHGREPFQGARRILVSMSSPFSEWAAAAR